MGEVYWLQKKHPGRFERPVEHRVHTDIHPKFLSRMTAGTDIEAEKGSKVEEAAFQLASASWVQRNFNLQTGKLLPELLEINVFTNACEFLQQRHNLDMADINLMIEVCESQLQNLFGVERAQDR